MNYVWNQDTQLISVSAVRRGLKFDTTSGEASSVFVKLMRPHYEEAIVEQGRDKSRQKAHTAGSFADT